jgi:Flp pilus assembly protein TadG
MKVEPMHHMTRASLKHERGLRMARLLPRRFWYREDGTVTVFAAIVFILMIGVGGIAVDIMRYETQRTQLQYTLDRAVLAAASLTQTLDPESVVESYFETAGLGDYRLRVDVEEGVNFRRVEAVAEMEIQTLFMSLFGQRVLTSPAAGAAEERIQNIEVSLVLDVSGSMASANRMNNLRPAARSFVTSVMEANDNPNGDQLVSVSIVPYDNAVNMGTTLASVFSLTNEHNYSRCARFYENDYTTTAINPAVPLQRMGHFDRDTDWWADPIRIPACHTDNTAAIIPWSNDEEDLHDLINSLQPNGWTAIDQGMRWAVALLDPAARPALSGLVTTGQVHDDFDGRPAAFNDEETLKIIVLMTDGENTRQYDLQDQYRSGPSPFWRNPSNGRLSIYRESTGRYWEVSNDRWRNSPDGGNNAVQLDYADLWNHIPARWMDDLLNNEPDSYIRGLRHDYRFDDIVDEYAADNGTVGDRRLRNICAAAHAQGIIVYTISFEAPARGREVMRDCASSDSHYYDVNGIDISNAFASIARSINQLRLIQ